MTGGSVHLALALDHTVAACGITAVRMLVLDDGRSRLADRAVHGTLDPLQVTCRRCRDRFAMHSVGFGFPLH